MYILCETQVSAIPKTDAKHYPRRVKLPLEFQYYRFACARITKTDIAASSMSDITQLLNAWNGGDLDARDKLVSLIYPEIKAIAHQLMRNERAVSLETTGLAHETYMKLVGQHQVNWSSRAHFFGAVAHAMRRILVDEARRRLASKRGAGATEESLDLVIAVANEPDRQVIALHEALDELEKEHPDAAKVVELRYFAGLTLEEAAELRSVTVHHVRRDWTLARAWLLRRLSA